MRDQQEQHQAPLALSMMTRIGRDLQKELFRKSLHFLIGLTPLLAGLFGTTATVALLGMGVLLYTSAEYLRMSGTRVPVISRLTEIAMRDRDANHFVLGPVTLGLGAMAALFLYPEPAASIAIYALAFGDGIASLAGKVFGSIRIPFTGGKSLEGSIACLVAIFSASILFVPGLNPLQVLLIAIGATLLEALPTKDFDNLVLPVGTGLLAMLLV